MRPNGRAIWVDLDHMDTDNYRAGVGVHPKPPRWADDSYERFWRAARLRDRSLNDVCRRMD